MLLIGGIPCIVLTVLIGYISAYTCYLLICCQYDEDEHGNRTKTRPTLHDIAVHNLGRKAGVIFIDLLQILLLFGNCVYQILTCGHMINALFPGNPLGFNGIILIFSVPLFPFAFVKSIILVSHFSCASVIVTSCAHLGILVYMFTKINDWVLDEFPLSTDIYQFSVSMGMVVFGFDTQLYVNSLDNKLKEGCNINRTIAWTHASSVLLKVLFGIAGVFTFGKRTRETITNNIDIVTLKYFFNLFYPLKFFLVFQFPYFSIIDLIQEKLFLGTNESCFPTCVNRNNALKWWAVLLRMSLVVLSVAVCLIFPDVAVMTGYAGCTVGTLVMFLLPVFFHLNMFWRRMRWYHLLHDFLVFLVGVVVVYFGIFSFVQREIMMNV